VWNVCIWFVEEASHDSRQNLTLSRDVRLNLTLPTVAIGINRRRSLQDERKHHFAYIAEIIIELLQYSHWLIHCLLSSFIDTDKRNNDNECREIRKCYLQQVLYRAWLDYDGQSSHCTNAVHYGGYSSGDVSVWLSACLSRWCSVPERLSRSSCDFQQIVAQSFWFSLTK